MVWCTSFNKCVIHNSQKSIITIHTFYLLFHFSLSDEDICFEFVNKIGTCCVQQVVKLRKRNVSWPAFWVKECDKSQQPSWRSNFRLGFVILMQSWGKVSRQNVLNLAAFLHVSKFCHIAKREQFFCTTIQFLTMFH